MNDDFGSLDTQRGSWATTMVCGLGRQVMNEPQLDRRNPCIFKLLQNYHPFCGSFADQISGEGLNARCSLGGSILQDEPNWRSNLKMVQNSAKKSLLSKSVFHILRDGEVDEGLTCESEQKEP